MTRLRLSFELPVMVGEFERDFDGVRAVVGKEGALQTGGRLGTEAAPQLRSGGVAQSEIGAVGHFVDLIDDGRVQVGIVVPEGVGPDGGIRVEVAVALVVPEPAAFAALDV